MLEEILNNQQLIMQQNTKILETYQLVLKELVKISYLVNEPLEANISVTLNRNLAKNGGFVTQSNHTN